ncbi:WXG100 family type VII secretion target [Micromonospora sp. NPDC049366]|uniref:WXG100 family type VII secretion target n=1 Tax=Micromonospora sp. NPDC049366 TaxID=3364271 RepID=UPI003791E813
MPNTLDIPVAELQAALQQFRELEQEAERVRRAVDEGVRGIGSHWYGPARTAYNAEIDNWLADYQTMVAQPMSQLLNWFQSMIVIMQDVEASNS